MPITRLYYKYHFKVDGEIVNTGVTGDIYLRAVDLRRTPGWEGGELEWVGARRVTLADARAWERAQAARGMPVVTLDDLVRQHAEKKRMREAEHEPA